MRITDPFSSLLSLGELEVEPGGVHVIERPLPCAGYDGHDPEAEFVDRVVSQERVVEAAGAVFDEVLAGLVAAALGIAAWLITRRDA